MYDFLELIKYIRFFLSSYRSDFAVRAGHSIGVFVSCLPDVIAQSVDAEKKAARADNTDENFKRLEAARRTGEES
jgi:hypothetical protein